MMAEKAKKPAIRFSGFTDAWEQREFSSFTQRRSEISDNAAYPRLEYEDIIPDQGILNKDIFKKVSLKKGIKFSKGDVLFGKLRPYLKNWFLPSFSGLAVGDFWVLYANNGDAAFLYYLLQTPEFFSISNQSAGSKMPRADWSLVSQYKFRTPSQKDEQQKIGMFFQGLDSLITLHQRKDILIKTLKNLKIHFQKTNAWEQRKFSDLVLIERGGSPRPIDAFITSASDGLNWVKIGDAPSQGKYITKTAEKIRPEGLSKTRQVQPGDLILSNSMSFGRPYIMGIYGCIHDGWLLIRSNNSVFDLTFLCHLLGTAQMLEQYRALAAGSTVNNLNKELVGSAKVTFPTFNEQIKIGQILECIDDLITLHQREQIFDEL